MTAAVYAPTRRDLERKLRRLIADGSRLERSRSRRGNRNEPREKSAEGLGEPFSTLTLISDRSNGRPWSRHTTDGSALFEHTYESRVADYQISWFGDEEERSVQFSTWIVSPVGVEKQASTLRDAGDPSDYHPPKITIRSMTELRQTDHVGSFSGGGPDSPLVEGRTTMDISVYYVRVARQEVGWYDRADIAIHHDGVQGLDRYKTDPIPDVAITVTPDHRS